MKTKLMTLLVAVATISAINAGWYDSNGNYHHGVRPVRDTGYAAGRAVEGTGEVAGDAVGGAADVVGGTIGGIFGGRGVSERMDERQQRRDQRRMDKEARRMRTMD